MNEQLIFNLTRRSAFNREDYFISSANNLSIKILDNWNKSFGTGLIIVGPSACGKSHLAAVWSKETSAIFYNLSTFVETDIKKIIKEHFIVLEDVEMLKLISGKKLNSVNLKTGPFPNFATDNMPIILAVLTTVKGISRIEETIFSNIFDVNEIFMFKKWNK